VLVRALDLSSFAWPTMSRMLTSTGRLAGSSGAIRCLHRFRIAALWGPAHGGSQRGRAEDAGRIGDISRVPEYVQGVKDKKYRLMGLATVFYKNMDRALP